jgi:molybdopterin synthase sulfur carrier subunit
METGAGDSAGAEIAPITVRYWASARAAAGVETDDLPVTAPISLSDVVRRASALHPGTRLLRVLEACSVLVGDEPMKSREPDGVLVRPGQIVEFLPPFAGG